MLDFSPSLADALVEHSYLERALGDCTPAANFLGNSEKEPPARLHRANPIQLRMFGDHPLVVRPEKKPWPKTIAPAGKKVSKNGVTRTAENQKPTDYEYSYTEIGEALGYSYERIRQIERVALRKLRIECERVGLTPDVFLRTWRGCR